MNWIKVIGIIGTVCNVVGVVCGGISQKHEIKKAAREAVDEVFKNR